MERKLILTYCFDIDGTLCNNTDGLVYILVPNVYEGHYQQQFTIPHTFYFSLNTLQLLLRNSGFEVQQILADRSPELALIASKQQLGERAILDMDNTEFRMATEYLRINSNIQLFLYAIQSIEWQFARLVKFVAPPVIYRFIHTQYRKRIAD